MTALLGVGLFATGVLGLVFNLAVGDAVIFGGLVLPLMAGGVALLLTARRMATAARRDRDR